MINNATSSCVIGKQILHMHMNISDTTIPTNYLALHSWKTLEKSNVLIPTTHHKQATYPSMFREHCYSALACNPLECHC
jgi:hypothetical protein